MADLFNIPTLMLCLFAGYAIFAVFVSAIWLKDRSNHALMLWASAFWFGAVGELLLALAGILPDWMAFGVGNMLAMSCLGLFWMGFLAFDNRPLSLGVAAIGAIVWAVFYFCVPSFAGDINLRVIVASILISVYSAFVAKAAWQGRIAEPLPARTAVALFFSTHALIYLVRVALTLAMPISLKEGEPHSVWYGVLGYELFIHALFSGLAVLAVIRERIELQYKTASETDALTAVLNRRAFMSRMSGDLDRNRTGGTLALLDIDHFKVINDEHGHGAGDAVLCGFCHLITATLPPGMVFGRIGGEEFGIYMPRSNLEEAAKFCELIRQAVALLQVHVDGKMLAVTVSVGVCPATWSGSNIASALSLADKALYAAKRSGRNRVTLLDASAGFNMVAETLASDQNSSTAFAA
ncbi:MAG: GGDEF domain-containing protein [Allorhizobium sp.]